MSIVSYDAKHNFYDFSSVYDSRQEVIKLTPALSNPTIPVGRQIERETGGRGNEVFHRLIQL